MRRLESHQYHAAMNSQMNNFLDAVDRLIALINAELRQRGIDHSVSQLDRQQLLECKKSPMDCLLNYDFPMFTPHRNLVFVDTKRQFGSYIVFGNDPAYNNFYVLDLESDNRVLAIDQESGIVTHTCARDFDSFLSAFAVLIDRDVANRAEQGSSTDGWIERAVAEAGGEEYQSFYEFMIA